ncbi:MAG: hypothetical protein GFH27_549325n36 [Chloroflexi bacterium AL-W]|nr:hypothetical protein [Chloroflexi bacterium AL-N1]NOK70114.1 hypothetical protein [Chloroflexi bacterium AL-N10]NOK77874.1 hypothetical protein [Chloroflexi bacterium AL-N5]NOK84883.1 hypothetical protein [Chloroflexi bacterium AL-W]NOK91862.1 hypothetical protein [Chloroflexi bacterium AL-N15]
MHQNNTETPLTTAEWQLLLDQDALRARRRYFYHVVLVANPNSPFRSSIAAFQHLTERTPNHFLSRAAKLLPQLLSSPIQHVWQDMTTQPYNHHNPYLHFSGPGVILQRIAHNIGILNEQAQQSGLAFFATPTQTARTSLKHMINRLVENPTPEKTDHKTDHTRLRTSWQLEVATLAIVLEELTLDHPLMVQATDFQSSLDPYPDESEWGALLHANPQTAHQQYHALLDEQTRHTDSIPFNLGESIAAFRAISGADW